MQKEIKISTKAHNELIDITKEIEKIVSESKVKHGLCNVFTMHATAAILINENYDPNIIDDFIEAISKLIPEGIWRHDRIDNNGASHIKSAIISPSEYIPIENNQLKIGTWQNIMFTEFDGPRNNRNIYLTILE